MVFCHNEKYIICTHRFGLITIINTEDYSFTTGAYLEQHGQFDHIHGVTKIVNEFVVLFERLVFSTSRGLYVANLTPDGILQPEEDGHCKECNITHMCMVNEETMIFAMNDEEGV